MHVLAVCVKILAGWFMLSITTLVLVGAAMYYGNNRSANAPSAKSPKVAGDLEIEERKALGQNRFIV